MFVGLRLACVLSCLSFALSLYMTFLTTYAAIAASEVLDLPKRAYTDMPQAGMQDNQEQDAATTIGHSTSQHLLIHCRAMPAVVSVQV